METNDTLILDIDNILKKTVPSGTPELDMDKCTPENPLPCQHKVGLGMALSICKKNGLSNEYIDNIKKSYIDKSMNINEAMIDIITTLKSKDISDKDFLDTKELASLMKLDLDFSQFKSEA